MKNRQGKHGREGTPTRRDPSRSPKKTVLVVGEGETESNYFRELRLQEDIRSRFAVTVKRGKGGSRDQIAQFAIERKNNSQTDYDEVWCVMDVETPEVRDSLNQALAMLQTEEITPCLSNPAFEFWLLCHFEKTARCFENRRAVETQLNTHWQKHFAADYEKADHRLFSRIADRTSIAVNNAKSVREKHHGANRPVADCNSCTEVYRLVERLLRDSD